MFDFKRPTLEDRIWAQPILSAYGGLGCENVFGNFYLWCDAYNTQICQEDGFLLRRSGWDIPAYGFPLGPEEPWPILSNLMDYQWKRKKPFRMWGLTTEQTATLGERYPGVFRFKLDRAGSDYIYHASDLISLSGRKYHSKRNHIAQFNRAWQWSYEDVTAGNLSDCLTIARIWQAENPGIEGSEQEQEALRRAAEAFEKLHLCGGLIRIDGVPAAFTLGEESNARLFAIHFEKALSAYQGLYAVINHEFAARRLSHYELINREEDLGLEGLRKAKLSYRPALILEKYLAESAAGGPANAGR